MMFALRASEVRLRRVNLFRQPILGSGPKMEAGAIEWIKRTELKI
jgi:hypothetical protein